MRVHVRKCNVVTSPVVLRVQRDPSFKERDCGRSCRQPIEHPDEKGDYRRSDDGNDVSTMTMLLSALFQSS